MALSQKWKVKIPLGFFLINRMGAAERANLVTLAVQKLEKAGAFVISIVCDAPTIHQSLLSKLGANLSTAELDPTLTVEGIDHPIFAFLDAPHSIKNIRNSFASLETIYNDKGTSAC